MAIKQSEAKRVLFGLMVVLLLLVSAILYNCIHCSDTPKCETVMTTTAKNSDAMPVAFQHKMCIIVPFRNRFEELLEFAPHMKRFLDQQQVQHEILVVNQVDRFRFNRASLINVGYKESSKTCDYIAMHDVDLLPMNDRLDYSYPGDMAAKHLSAPGLHPKYDYETFIGGIFLISRRLFHHVDGMSNKYWGWGLEDDEFFVRLRQSNIKVSRPDRIGSGKSNTFKHIHNSSERKRDTAKCYNQMNLTRRRDRQTGLSTVDYGVSSKRSLQIDGTPVTLLDVELVCDTSLTPWCNCTGAPKETEPVDRSRDADVIVPIIKNKKPKKDPFK